MKKVFLFAAGIMLAAAVFAADRRPVLTVNSSNNYRIVIDERSYFGSNITLNLDDYYSSYHTIKVYEMRRGLFSNEGRERMVASSSFQTGQNDIVINIDSYGYINIREINNYNYNGYDRNDQYNRDWNDRDDRRFNNRNNRDWDRDNRNRNNHGCNNGRGNRRF